MESKWWILRHQRNFIEQQKRTKIIRASINYLSKILLNNSILSPFITSLIGLIPNCAASVILTELYLNSTISLGALIGGLLTSSGSSLLVLIKNNKNQKENLSIILLLYTLGVLSGIIIELISLIK